MNWTKEKLKNAFKLLDKFHNCTVNANMNY